MATEIRMPQLGLTMTEGMVGEWLKKVGDVVKKGDVLVQITTDKLSSEVESEADGVLHVICAKEGEVVPVQELLAIVGGADEKINIESNTTSTVNKSDAELKDERIPRVTIEVQKPRIKASPLAKKTAAKMGVDLSQIEGSGFGGRIRQSDVLAQERKIIGTTLSIIEKKESTAEKSTYVPMEISDIIKPLTNMRRVIGMRMTESKHNAPHVTLTTEANVDKVIAFRNRLNSRNGDMHFSYTDIFIKMAATALRNTPSMNTSIDKENIIIHDRINIGMAVALKEGLVVPVVKDADCKGLKAICKDTKDLIGRARDNKLTGDEMVGGTFTVSNLGNYDIDAFTPIINLPESAILGIGRIVRKPIVNENDEIVPASMMTLSLSFDHRIVDGATAAQFLKMIKEYLEDPEQMFL